MSDDELVALLRHGSDPAFETLAARYQPRLLRFCASMLGSREDAEDALQDVLISALGALRADDREINLRPWLYRIARNRCIDDLRRARRLSFELLDDQQPERGGGVAESVSGRERLRDLVDDVRALPDSQATALLAREFDGRSYEQIATAMDTTVPGVKSLLVRARAGLRASSASRAGAACPATTS
jgi:RNA polymerase sigma factor (sigma-70 family)